MEVCEAYSMLKGCIQSICDNKFSREILCKNKVKYACSRDVCQLNGHMSYSLNTVNSGYIGDYIDDYCKGYSGEC